jgi:predicted enzyme related to lactoylglutathione lyase
MISSLLEFNILIHFPPIEIPEENFNTIKIHLTVESHEEARDRVEKLGGKALEGVWSNPIFKACNISDPEGNHIQIREFAL